MIRNCKFKLGEIVQFYNPDLKCGLGGNGQLWEIVDIMDERWDYIDTVVIRHVTKGNEIYASDYELAYLRKLSIKQRKLAELLYK